MIVKHDPDELGSTNKSGISKSAFDNAEQFKNRLEESRIDKVEQSYKNNIKAQKRGKEALEKLHVKPLEIKQKPTYDSSIQEKLQRNTRQRQMENDVEKMFSGANKPKHTLKKATNNKPVDKKKSVQITAVEDNKQKHKVMMPEVIIEEEIEDEKSEIDIRSPTIQEAQIKITNNDLPQYPQNVNMYQQMQAPVFIPNYQNPLPNYSVDPNMNMQLMYQQFLNNQHNIPNFMPQSQNVNTQYNHQNMPQTNQNYEIQEPLNMFSQSKPDGYQISVNNIENNPQTRKNDEISDSDRQYTKSAVDKFLQENISSNVRQFEASELSQSEINQESEFNEEMNLSETSDEEDALSGMDHIYQQKIDDSYTSESDSYTSKMSSQMSQFLYGQNSDKYDDVR